MSASSKEVTSKDINEEMEKKVYVIVQKRKRYPKKCSVLLSKKLKMEHFILEDTKILLDPTFDNMTLDDLTPEDSDASTSKAVIKSSDILSRIEALDKEYDDMIAVCEQLISEKDNKVNSLCTPQTPSSASDKC